MTDAPPFKRTTCACQADRENCRRPGYLIPGDIERIAEYTGLDRSTIEDLIEPGRGAIARLQDTGEIAHIPTLIPATENGWCVFLNRGLCDIHPVAPFGCAFFDVHMRDAEWQRRARWALPRVAADAAYQDLVRRKGRRILIVLVDAEGGDDRG